MTAGRSRHQAAAGAAVWKGRERPGELVYPDSMTANVSTRPSTAAVQHFLADLVRTEGPAQFIQLLLDDPRWVDLDWLRYAEEYVGNRENIKAIFTTRQPVNLWKRVVLGAQRASSVTTFDQLARAASEETVLLWDGFIKILQTIDARSEAKQFGMFLAVREEWTERLRQINEIEKLNQLLDLKYEKSGEPAVASGVRLLDLAIYANAEEPIAVDESTLLYLSAFIRFYVDFGLNNSASSLVPVLERLEGVGFNVRQLREVSDGQPTSFRRTNSGRASLWFRERSIPLEQYIPLVNAVASGKLAFSEAVSEAQLIAVGIFDHHAQRDKSSDDGGFAEFRPSTREFFLVTCSAAFAVIAASNIENREQSNASIQMLKKIVEGAWWDKLSQHEKASTIYNICSFMMAQIENLGEPRHELLWAREHIRSSIEGAAFRGHPGLERDSRLAHARIIAELSKWDPRMGADAIAEFERGLQVPWARFDCEARGLGLCDLAGAMWRFMNFAHDSSAIEEGAIEALYKTALIYVPRDKYSFGRITVLTNYAIFLNERQTGNDAHNQELALRLVDESIEIELEWRQRVEGELQSVDELDSPATPHRMTIQASVWLTRGNIIRARTFGQMPAGSSILVQIGALPKGLDDVTASAIASYQEGLRALGETGHDARRGLLYLNIGYAYLENRTEQAQHEHAITAFRQAIRFLEGLPHDGAQARVAEIEALFSSSSNSPRRQLLTWQTELRRCASVFEDCGDLPRACRALILRSRILGRVGRPAQLATASEAASRAAVLAARLGGGELLVHALQAEARSFVAWMHSASETQRITLAEKASVALAEALSGIDTLLGRNLPLSTSIFLQEQRSAVAANIIWLQDKSKPAAIDAQSHLLTLASAADVLASRTNVQVIESTDARHKMLRIEDLLWASGRAANVEQHVADEVDQLVDALDDLQRSLEMEAILGSSSEEQSTTGLVEDEQDATEESIVIQFVVSEWGGLAVIREPETPLRTIQLPVNRATIYQWLHGSIDGQGWLDFYETLRTQGLGGNEWRSQCEVLQAQITQNIWGPLVKAGVILEGRRVYVVPGQFAGLPLHTGFLGERLLMDAIAGFGYLPTLGATRLRPPVTVQRGLLVLSDPVQFGQSELPATIEEVANVSHVFLAHGVQTRVLAHSWGRTGSEVFLEPHRLADGVDIGDAPTPDNTLAALAGADLFVYAGHGHGVGSFGGALALTDGNGKRSDLSLMKALASSPLSRGAGIVLSACETAWEMSGMTHGRTSIASTFLRLGASFVLGSLWLISDARASIMSNAFVRALLKGGSPEHAFVQGIRDMIRNGSHVSRWGAYCVWFGQAVPRAREAAARQC